MNKTKLFDKLRLYCLLHNIAPQDLAGFTITCDKCSKPCNHPHSPNKRYHPLMAQIENNKLIDINIQFQDKNKPVARTYYKNKKNSIVIFTCVGFINHFKKMRR